MCETYFPREGVTFKVGKRKTNRKFVIDMMLMGGVLNVVSHNDQHKKNFKWYYVIAMLDVMVLVFCCLHKINELINDQRKYN